MRQTLDSAGYEAVTLIGPEGGQYNSAARWLGSGFEELEQDAELDHALGAFDSHSYPQQNYSLDSHVADYINAVSKFPEKDRWQTEYCSATWPDASETGRLINAVGTFASDMAWVQNNYWCWWLGWDSRYPITNAGQETMIGGDGVHSVEKNSFFYTFQKIFTSVPVGSRMMRMETNDASVKNAPGLQSDMVAFSTENGTVAIYINRSETSKTYRLNGLSGKSAVIDTANNDESVLKTNSVRNIQNGTIENAVFPAKSINIIVTDQEDVAYPRLVIDDNANLSYDDGAYISREQTLTLTGSVDEAAAVRINGTEVDVDGQGRFSYETRLTGENLPIEITATDASGNITPTVSRLYRYDPNFLKVELDGTLPASTNQQRITITGKVNAASAVTVNGTPCEVQGLTFSARVNLQEGKNSFEIAATDDRGNRASASYTVFCDSVAPEITVDNTAFTTHDYEYIVSGSVSEPVKNVKVNGLEFFVREDRSFVGKALLQEGTNSVTVEAQDLYGNIGEKTFSVTMEKNGQTAEPTDGTAYSRRTESPVTVDGILDEPDWKLDNKAMTTYMGTNPNNIVNFGTLWDDDYLYIGARVFDDKQYFDRTQIYFNDAVELFFNPSNQKAGAYENGDVQIFLSKLADGSLYRNKIDYPYGWHDTEDGYTVEFAVPWSELGLEPAVDLPIGFDLDNIDKDKPGAREFIMGWYGSADNYRDTSQFGTILLKPALPQKRTDADVEVVAGENESKVTIPAGEFIRAVNDSEDYLVKVAVILPYEAPVSRIELSKDALKAAAKARSGISVALLDEDCNPKASWRFDGRALGKEKRFASVNLAVTVAPQSVRPEDELLKVPGNAANRLNWALTKTAVSVQNDGKFPGKAELAVPIPEAERGDRVFLYRMDPDTDRPKPLPGNDSKKILSDGTATFEVPAGGNYLAITSGIRYARAE